jgi:hypothetical protein
MNIIGLRRDQGPTLRANAISRLADDTLIDKRLIDEESAVECSREKKQSSPSITVRLFVDVDLIKICKRDFKLSVVINTNISFSRSHRFCYTKSLSQGLMNLLEE